MSKEEKVILKYALKNAVAHDGDPRSGPVISGFLGEMPEHKEEFKKYLPLIKKTVKKVGGWDLKKQEEELLKIDPHALDKPTEEKELSTLPNVKRGSFKTRLPPGPEKYLHVGHAISFMRNYLYAQEYDGDLVLRFEDTNPATCEKKYYQAIRDDLESLGISYSEEIIESQRLDHYYEKCEELIKKDKIYVCTCTPEQVSEGRWEKTSCECRARTPEKNLELWKAMLETTAEGEAIARYKGDMASENASLRDPTMFRIVTQPHPLTGREYGVWPSYDFAAAYEDGKEGMTHVIRTAEFATQLQKKLIEDMGFKVPEYVEYGRFTIKGAVTQGRENRKLVEEGVVKGWDDPRMATVRGLLRRGIVPETIKELCYEVGLSKASAQIDVNFVYSLNRRVLNDVVERRFLVNNPVKIRVKDAPDRTVSIPNHPTEDLGERKVKTEGVFFVNEGDVEGLEEGELFRLKDLYNVRKKEGSWVYAGDELIKDSDKVQWVTPDAVEVVVVRCDPLVVDGELNMKSELRREEALAEPSVKELGVGDMVQFERYGFCRKDGDAEFIYSHA